MSTVGAAESASFDTVDEISRTTQYEPVGRESVRETERPGHRVRKTDLSSEETTDPSSEGFKPCPGDRSLMDVLTFEQETERLSPVVVVATIALIGVFVVGLLYRAIGLVI